MNKSEEKMKRFYEFQGWEVIHNGFPDFFLYKWDKKSKSYIYCWKEIKNRGDCLKENQKEVLRIFKKMGFSIEVIRPYGLKIPNYEKKSSREEEIKILRGTGLTYQKIGHIFGVSRQRIYQILNGKKQDDIIISKIIGKSREKELVTIRHLIIFFLRERLKLSYPEIAKIMDKKYPNMIYVHRQISKMIGDKNKNLS